MAVEIGAVAPEFTLQDANENQGYSLTEALARGPVLLGIYKSSCQASKTAFPFLERISQVYPGEHFTVWGVSQDSANVTRSFARRYNITFPLLLDENDYQVSRAYDIQATPSLFLLNRDGQVVFQGMGFQKPAMNELSAAVAELLQADAVDITEGTDDVPGWVPG
ncbi:MAG TPA: TlpA disulfide reductase family protein [Thermomicrobiaceae bacterium]|nr:TlpA disulfide reductase family protein [Thermomicrobiaceae bacterium]